MLNKQHRLKEREVKLALKKGKPIFGSFFTCVVFPNRYTQNHRLAIVVGNKHTKSAVLRNAYRRSIYLVCSPQIQKELHTRGRDIVLVTKKGIKITKEFLEEKAYLDELSGLLEKAIKK